MTPYCTRRTGRRPRTPSCRTRPRTLATPNSSSPAVTAISIYGPPRCGCSARSRNGRRRDHALTHRGHTPLGAAHATAYVHARDLTAAATNRRALRARDGHTPVQRRLRVRKERLSDVAIVPQPCLFCGGPGRDPGAHARGLHPLAAPLAPLPPGGTRGGPPPPTWGQGPVGGLVALRRRHVDGGVLLRTGARGRGGAAPRHNPIRPAGRDLGGQLPPPHAPAGGLRVGASQPPAGATPPRAPKRGGEGAPVAHCGGGRPPSPSPAPRQGLRSLPPCCEWHSGVPTPREPPPVSGPAGGVLEAPARRPFPTVDHRARLHDRMGGAHRGGGVGVGVGPVVRGHARPGDPCATIRRHPAPGVGAGHPAETHHGPRGGT